MTTSYLTPITASDAEVIETVRNLLRQVSYFDGETPMTEADHVLVREYRSFLIEAQARGLQF